MDYICNFPTIPPFLPWIPPIFHTRPTLGRAFRGSPSTERWCLASTPRGVIMKIPRPLPLKTSEVVMMIDGIHICIHGYYMVISGNITVIYHGYIYIYMDIFIYQISMTPRSFPGILEFIGDHFAGFCSPKNRGFLNGREWYGLLGFQRKLWLIIPLQMLFQPCLQKHQRLNAYTWISK